MSKAKVIKEITLSIKGRDWSFKLLTDASFNKLHNYDDGDRPAVTMPQQYEVHFRKSDWTVIDIRHELGHVYYAMSDNESADPTPGQVEEQMCTIIGNYLADIAYYLDRIVEKWQT
jgi:hypothetical protein